ncbi:MAG: hypothetical protein WA161_15815 [Pseudomonas sp.]|uniref:hypothetical protein n=1 Tax=Pseudomonas sp. TaxID=306 RepID=UPI003BB5E3DE
MANNVATKGFAYRLGHGLGAVVACLRAGEHRVLERVARSGRSAWFVAKSLILAVKLAAVAAVLAALLPAISWLVSFILGFVFLGGLVYLVANSVKGGNGGLDDASRAPHGRDVFGFELDWMGNRVEHREP